MKLTRQTVVMSIAVLVIIIGLVLAYFYLLKPKLDQKHFPLNGITVAGELVLPDKYELKGQTVAVTLESGGAKETKLVMPGKFSLDFPGSFSYKQNIKLTAVYKLESDKTRNLFDGQIVREKRLAGQNLGINFKIKKPSNDYSVDFILTKDGNKVTGNGNIYQVAVGDNLSYYFEWSGTMAKWAKPSFSAEAKCVKSIPTDSIDIGKDKIEVKKEGFALLDCYSGNFGKNMHFGQPKTVKIISEKR